MSRLTLSYIYKKKRLFFAPLANAVRGTPQIRNPFEIKYRLSFALVLVLVLVLVSFSVACCSSCYLVAHKTCKHPTDCAPVWFFPLFSGYTFSVFVSSCGCWPSVRIGKIFPDDITLLIGLGNGYTEGVRDQRAISDLIAHMSKLIAFEEDQQKL